jgi:hypothetical protein
MDSDHYDNYPDTGGFFSQQFGTEGFVEMRGGIQYIEIELIRRLPQYRLPELRAGAD